MNIPGLVMQEPKTNADIMDPLIVPDLDELAEKGKSIRIRILKV